MFRQTQGQLFTICRFLLNGHSLEDVSLYIDVGTDKNANLIQVSRSPLEEGDMISLRKANTVHRLSQNPGADKFITFSISLRHLDAAMAQGMLHILPMCTKSVQSR